MGHEREGSLPKTHRWQAIVQRMAAFPGGDAQVSDIAHRTLQNVRGRFRRLVEEDESVKAAFEFLVILSVASRSASPGDELGAAGIELPAQPSLLSLARAVHQWVADRGQHPEYREIARGAAVDAIAHWQEQHRPQPRLLDVPLDPYETWRKAGNGAGFCELSRLFFANLTERYLNYFLDREASAALPDLEARDRFHREIQEHVENVSRHAFETARITQSFAAGWFNKHTAGGIPTERDIDGFLTTAFKKLRGEINREGQRP